MLMVWLPQRPDLLQYLGYPAGAIIGLPCLSITLQIATKVPTKYKEDNHQEWRVWNLKVHLQEE